MSEVDGEAGHRLIVGVGKIQDATCGDEPVRRSINDLPFLCRRSFATSTATLRFLTHSLREFVLKLGCIFFATASI